MENKFCSNALLRYRIWWEMKKAIVWKWNENPSMTTRKKRANVGKSQALQLQFLHQFVRIIFSSLWKWGLTMENLVISLASQIPFLIQEKRFGLNRVFILKWSIKTLNNSYSRINNLFRHTNYKGYLWSKYPLIMWVVALLAIYNQIFISYILLQLTSWRKHHVSLKLDVKMLPQLSCSLKALFML